MQTLTQTITTTLEKKECLVNTKGHVERVQIIKSAVNYGCTERQVDDGAVTGPVILRASLSNGIQSEVPQEPCELQ